MSRNRTRRVRLSAVLAAAIIASCSPPGSGDDVVVLAAASTIDALEAAADDFRERRGIDVALSFGATSTVSRQIVSGAPATLLLAASSEWADYVERRTEVAERTTLVGNELVIVVAADARIATADAAGILLDPGVERVALADPESVPAGVYAREALRNLNVWDRLLSRLIPTVDVRAALVLVINGEVDVAIVYATDAASTDRARVAATLDPRLHGPVEYPLLLLAGSNAASRQFFDFLVSEEGRAHFLSRGFSTAKPSPE